MLMPGFCPYTIAPSMGLGTPWRLLPTHWDTPDCPTPRLRLLVTKSPTEPHEHPGPPPLLPKLTLATFVNIPFLFLLSINISLPNSLPSA